MISKNMEIIGAVAVVCIIIVATLMFSGVIHNGSFASTGSTYGPETYKIGTNLPTGDMI